MSRAVGALLALVLIAGTLNAQQQLGNRILGTLGLQAGSQPEPGLYLLERFGYFQSSTLLDNFGHVVPIKLDLKLDANTAGAGWVYKLPILSAYFNASVGIPTIRLNIRTNIPEAGLDRFGLGDIYVQPIRLGWKRPRYDIVAGYAFYVPSDLLRPEGSNGGGGFWVNEFQFGGTVHFNRAKTWQASALASYNQNHRSRGIDLKRGNTVQIQGGVGYLLCRRFELGVATYALWQVSDDGGADLPLELRGLRDQAFGIGPEFAVTVASIRSRFSVRYGHDIRGRARTFGQIVVAGITLLAWK